MLIEFEYCQNILESIHGRRAKSIFHVGAHTGEEIHSYTASGIDRVVWFEANPQLIEPLSRHIGAYPSVQQIICPFALSDANQHGIEFNIASNCQSSSLLAPTLHLKHYPWITFDEKITVSTYRLDSLLALSPSVLSWREFQFLNIDTQGSELKVLRGMGDTIKNPSLIGIYLEVNYESLYDQIPLIAEIDSYLLSFEFVRLVTKWTKEGWGDALFVRTLDAFV